MKVVRVQRVKSQEIANALVDQERNTSAAMVLLKVIEVLYTTTFHLHLQNESQ